MRRVLLLSLLCILLCVVPTIGFNPYSDEDDTGSGVIPETSTIECTRDVNGVEHCESIAKVVPDESELEARVAEAEAERASLAAAKAEAKAARDAKYAAEREAKREKRRLEEEALRAEREAKRKPNADDYKIKEPLKKLRVDYYKYFGVPRDATTLQIRKAANAMAALNHPDKCDTELCRDNMVVINQARDVLQNEEKREQYDFLLRWGFKVYDEQLYQDMYKQYLENPEDMPTGFDRIHDPSSDFSAMNLSEEGAGWLLLLTGTIAVAMMAYPAFQFYERRKDASLKKASAKSQLLAEKERKQRELEESLNATGGKAKPGQKRVASQKKNDATQNAQ